MTLDETVEQAWQSRASYGAPDWEVEGWVTSYAAIAAGDLTTTVTPKTAEIANPGEDELGEARLADAGITGAEAGLGEGDVELAKPAAAAHPGGTATVVSSWSRTSSMGTSAIFDLHHLDRTHGGAHRLERLRPQQRRAPRGSPLRPRLPQGAALPRGEGRGREVRSGARHPHRRVR